jgi:copper transporter 1
MMHMSFYWGYDVTLLFDAWKVSTLPYYCFCWFCVLLLSILQEFLITYRLEYMKNPATIIGDSRGDTVAVLDRRIPRSSLIVKGIAACLYGVNHLLAYLLMLIVMTYNLGLLVAVVLGLCVGFLLFGLRRNSTVPEAELHC